MSKYTADIGTWERGKKINLPNATNLEEALEEAEKELNRTVFSNLTEEPYVVKIYCEGRVVCRGFG